MSTVDWAGNTRYIIDRHDAEVRAVGLGDVWDRLLADEPSGSRTLLLGTVGALATYMHETGIPATST